MKVVAICNSKLRDVMPNTQFYNFVLDGESIPISLLDAPDLDYTELLSPNSVVLEVSAFSCNFRDRTLLHLFYENCKTLSGKQKYFYSPIGSEFAGTVLEIGSAVTSLRKGDRVMANTSYPFRTNGSMGGVPTNFASQGILLLEEDQLIKVPDYMSDEVAAAFSVSAQTAYSMVRRADLKKGDNVLVTAATSNTSLSVIERLKNRGVNIFGLSSKAEKYEKVLCDMGVKKVMSLSDLVEEGDLNTFFIKMKFDAVFDPFFDLYFEKLMPFMNFGGRYVFCGFYNQHPSFGFEEHARSLYPLITKCITSNISLIGNCLGRKEDLIEAIFDYSNKYYVPPIDSVHTEDAILDFLVKSFVSERFGKVVYKYKN